MEQAEELVNAQFTDLRRSLFGSECLFWQNPTSILQLAETYGDLRHNLTETVIISALEHTSSGIRASLHQLTESR